jgi:hypothetical protein
MKKGGFIFSMLLWVTILAAQQQRTLHQTFELAGVEQVVFELYDSYEVETWAGSALLMEVQVQMWEEHSGLLTDAPDSIFKHFLEKGRYQSAGTLSEGKILKIRSKDMTRAQIRTARGVCSETVSIKILLPESFQKSGDHSWARTK